MKKPVINSTEHLCTGCNGTGFPAVKQPTRPGVRIYPEPCKECLGKGRIRSSFAGSSVPSDLPRPMWHRSNNRD